MQRINEDIKSGQFHKVYLLYGQEDYLRKQYRDKLKNALMGGADAMNCTYMEGAGADVSQMIGLAETLPFFADRRVVICENTGWFKTGSDELSSYLKEICETTVLVFAEKEVDKRSKSFKAAASAGLAVEFGEQDANTLKRWIAGIVAKEGKQMAERDILFFLERCGSDMANIRMELEKICCYCMDRESITAKDVEAVCTRNITDQIFEMIHAMAEKKQKRAMDLYYDLLALKVAPMKILALISRQFNMLLQVKQLKNNGYDNRRIAEKTGLPPFVIGKYVTQASHFKKEYLMQALSECVETDEAVKTGRMNDVMGVEILLVKCSG